MFSLGRQRSQQPRRAGLPQLRDVDNSAGRSTATETAATCEPVQNLLNIHANCRWLKRALDLVVTQNA